jgi:integrase
MSAGANSETASWQGLGASNSASLSGDAVDSTASLAPVHAMRDPLGEDGTPMAIGHILKRGQRWYYVHRADDPTTGRHRQIWTGGFTSRREAEQALRDSMTDLANGSWKEPSRLTYAAYVNGVWLPHIVDQVESSTLDSYTRNMRMHVLPKVGAIHLQKLTAAHLNALYQGLRVDTPPLPGNTNRRRSLECYGRIGALPQAGGSYGQIAEQIRREFPSEADITRDAVARIVARARQGPAPTTPTLSARTVNCIHTIVSSSLREAVRFGYIRANPAGSASPPRLPRARVERSIWTAGEARAFISWARSEELRPWPAWAFIATSGARRGAALGLRWRDVDLDGGTAQLIWTVTSVRGKLVVKPYGKSGPPHAISLDAATVAMLRTWRVQQAEEPREFAASHICESPEPGCDGQGYHLRDLVFSREDGDYLQPETFSAGFVRAQRRYTRRIPPARSR